MPKKAPSRQPNAEGLSATCRLRSGLLLTSTMSPYRDGGKGKNGLSELESSPRGPSLAGLARWPSRGLKGPRVASGGLLGGSRSRLWKPWSPSSRCDLAEGCPNPPKRRHGSRCARSPAKKKRVTRKAPKDSPSRFGYAGAPGQCWIVAWLHGSPWPWPPPNRGR